MEFLKREYAKRPIWMNLIFLFCLYMTFIYLPWDIFIKPLDQDQEVWFGLMFTGWAAKVGAVAHWLVYGAGAWGFYHMRAWMHPWAGVYVAQVALSMFLWSVLDDRGGIIGGTIAGGIFMALASAFWVARDRFTAVASTGAHSSSKGDGDDDEYEGDEEEEYEGDDADPSDSDEDDDNRSRSDGPSDTVDDPGGSDAGSSDDT